MCRALDAHGGESVTTHIVAIAWRWLAAQIDSGVTDPHPGRRQAWLIERGLLVARVLEAASDAQGVAVVTTLQTQEDAVVPLLVAALRVLSPVRAAPRALAADAQNRLGRLAVRPVRAPDDWSILWTGCGCEDCDRLSAFLASSTARSVTWSLAQARRDHLERHIQEAGLPIRRTTRRQGRPYSLILDKTEQLFRREEEERQQIESDRAWVGARIR